MVGNATTSNMGSSDWASRQVVGGVPVIEPDQTGARRRALSRWALKGRKGRTWGQSAGTGDSLQTWGGSIGTGASDNGDGDDGGTGAAEKTRAASGRSGDTGSTPSLVQSSRPRRHSSRQKPATAGARSHNPPLAATRHVMRPVYLDSDSLAVAAGEGSDSPGAATAPVGTSLTELASLQGTHGHSQPCFDRNTRGHGQGQGHPSSGLSSSSSTRDSDAARQRHVAVGSPVALYREQSSETRGPVFGAGSGGTSSSGSGGQDKGVHDGNDEHAGGSSDGKHHGSPQAIVRHVSVGSSKGASSSSGSKGKVPKAPGKSALQSSSGSGSGSGSSGKKKENERPARRR